MTEHHYRNKLRYVSEITGSGKTMKLLDEISKSKEKYIVAFPSRDLCSEVANTLESRKGTNIVVINSDTTKNPSQYLSEILSCPGEFRTIITTHAALHNVISEDIYNSLGDWNLCIDEEFPIHEVISFSVSEYSEKIIDGVLGFDDYDETFMRVVPRDEKTWQEIHSSEFQDTFMEHPSFVKMISYAMSEEFDCLIPKKLLKSYFSKKADSKNRAYRRFTVVAVLKNKFIESFKTTTFLCSQFESTITYRMLQWRGFTNIPRVEYDVPKTHPNSHLVTIHYFSEKNWSLSTKNTPMKGITRNKEETLLIDEVKNFILRDIGNKDFIYTANKDERDGFGSGTLVVSLMGVNTYTKVTKAVFMPSLNATASEAEVLGFFGMTRAMIDHSRSVLTAYQFVSRCAIRDPNNEKEVSLYVMDKRTAIFIKTLLPDAQLVYHNWKEYYILPEKKEKTKKVIPAKDRSFVSRVRKRLIAGETLRESTLKKYDKILDEYYR